MASTRGLVSVRCFDPFARSAQRRRDGDREMKASTSDAATLEAGSFLSQSFRWKQFRKKA